MFSSSYVYCIFLFASPFFVCIELSLQYFSTSSVGLSIERRASGKNGVSYPTYIG